METVWLQRPGADVPWGFRLHGGRDYETPLSVQKVTSGSIAATGLAQGDVILRIGETNTQALTYAQAMDVIKNSGNLLQLSISKRGGQDTYSPQVDAASNMSSPGALHDLFQDMYRYSDTYAQEGAQSHTQPAPTPPSSYSYQPSYSTGGGSAPDHSTNFDQYGRQPQYTSGSDPYHQQHGNIGAGAVTAPPAVAPPTYADVQTQREAYPYQPTPAPSTPSYPYQPSAAPPASNSHQYPHSVSSSTSELSDISSGFGASDGKPSGTSPAMGRPMTSPPSGGMAKQYASGGSSMDSSSGVGSYNCETPEHADTTYTPQPVGRPDSFPAPPPSLHEASFIRNNIREPQSNAEDNPNNPSSPIIDPVTAPPPAPAHPPPSPPPPPPPPPPPMPSSFPSKSWKAQQADTSSYQPAQPTRLEQQLASMNMDADYSRQNSYPYQSPGPQSPSHQPSFPPPPPAPAPYYGGSRTPTSPATPPAPKPQPVIPDAVLNMAARGGSDKKPFTYTPDMESIKEQRDKVRRKAPTGGMPRYQQMLNLPKFDDAPSHPGHIAHTPPAQAPITPEYAPGPGEANVAHLQYNSPLQMYSEDNVSVAFTGQTDGVVTGVGGLKKDPTKDVTQSPVYKMIHGLDGEKPKPRPVNTQMSAEGKVQNDGKSSSGETGNASVRHGVSFRVLQWLTDTDGEERVDEGHRQVRGPAPDDEMCFTGVLDRSEIPSKSFHRLQNMTADSDIDTTSIRHNVSGDAQDEVIGGYDQASIRYTGKNIPSKSFRMLQSMTGDDTSGPELTVPGQQRRQRRQRPEPQPTEPESNPDDIVDISYVGANIPSRSFKVLQHAVGGDDNMEPERRDDEDEYDGDGAAFDDMYYLGENIPSRSFHLLQSAVGNDPHVVATERRRRRRNRITSRQNSMAEEEMIAKQSDKSFDEQAYLAGNVPISVAPDDIPTPKRAARSSSREVAPWQADSDRQTANNTVRNDTDTQTANNTVRNENFDEDAYLSGRTSILGNDPKKPPRPTKSEMMTKAQSNDDTEVTANNEPFDEDAYLSGRINIMSGDKTVRPADATTQPYPDTTTESTDDQPEVTQQFDEATFLAGKLNMLGGEPQQRPEKVKVVEEPEWAKQRRIQLSRRKKAAPPETNGPYDNINNEIQKKEPHKEDVEESKPAQPFDENAYLAGQVIFLGGNPAAPKREPKSASGPTASWEKPTQEDSTSPAEGFDEDAYLRGKVPILRESVDRELPPREEKPRKCRERATWERPNDEDVDAEKMNGDGEFDENTYLAKRSNPYVRTSVERDVTSPVANGGSQFTNTQARKFHYLRRSMSREESPSSDYDQRRHSSFDSADDDVDDSNKAYQEMVYVGDKIPSKTFLRLKRCMARKEKAAQDPIDHLKERLSDGLDMDNLTIDHHDPDEYMEQLKKTVQQNSNIKIEAIPNEVTDF